MDRHKQFYAMITGLFGPEDAIYDVQTNNPPKLVIFVWRDLPEKGITTFVTYGISEIHMPEWKHGRPELILSLHTTNPGWGQALGFIASSFRGKSLFSYGETFKLDSPATDESEMSAFLLFAPSFLDKNQARLDLSGHPVHLVGAYPLYAEELAVYQAVGLEKFWHNDNFDMYNVHRQRVTQS